MTGKKTNAPDPPATVGLQNSNNGTVQVGKLSDANLIKNFTTRVIYKGKDGYEPRSYVQGGHEGYESFHLSENHGCWVNYSKCPWKYDNGISPPEKIYFTNYKFNLAKRTFEGRINTGWRNYNTIANWDYNFTLSEDYHDIDSGLVKSIGVLDKDTIKDNFNKQIFYTLLRKED